MRKRFDALLDRRARELLDISNLSKPAEQIFAEPPRVRAETAGKRSAGGPPKMQVALLSLGAALMDNVTLARPKRGRRPKNTKGT